MQYHPIDEACLTRHRFADGIVNAIRTDAETVQGARTGTAIEVRSDEQCRRGTMSSVVTRPSRRNTPESSDRLVLADPRNRRRIAVDPMPHRLVLITLTLVFMLPWRLGAQVSSLANVPLNKWTQLSTGITVRRNARAFADCTSDNRSISNPVNRVYGGTTYGDGRLFYFGGGHNGYPGNDVELFDVHDLTWRQQYLPECLPSCCTTNPQCNTCTAGTLTGAHCGLEGTNTTDCGTGGICSVVGDDATICKNIRGGGGTALLTPSGLPYTEHMYVRYAWDAPRQRFLVATTGTDRSTDTNGGGALWSWQVGAPAGTNRGWKLVTTNVPRMPGTDISMRLLFYAPDRQSVLWLTDQLDELNPTNNTWISRARPPVAIRNTLERFQTYDSKRHRHLVIPYDFNEWYWYEPLTDTWSGPIIVPDALRRFDSKWPGALAYDPVADVVLVLTVPVFGPECGPRCSGGPIVTWELDPSTNVFRQVNLGAVSATGNGPVGAGRWNMFHYDPINSLFLFINDRSFAAESGSSGAEEGDLQTWALRYERSSITPAATAGAGTPGAATPTPGTATPVQPPATPTNTGVAGSPVTATPTAVPRNGVLDLPIVVQELLPADDSGSSTVPGRVRSNEPVTAGIPLGDYDGITDPLVLAVHDGNGTAIPAQFRVLRRHPSGNIQWLLVDTKATVGAGGTTTLRLVRGTNPASGVLATDGSTIAVDTGVAQFTIRRTNQNIVNSAVINGVTVLSGGHSGGLEYVDGQGTQFSSTADGSSTAVIEENGPLKAVIKMQGRLVSPGGVRSLGYTVRLTFLKDDPAIKARVSLENAFRDSVTRKIVRSVAIRLPLNFTPTQATFATKTSTLQTALTAGETAYLYQGNTTHKERSEAVRVSGYTSFFREENDWGLRLTGADLDVAAPPYDNSGNSLYPGVIVGTTLILSVDGGPNRTVTFLSSYFPQTLNGNVRARDVASAIQAEVAAQSANAEPLRASIAGSSSSDSGVLRISSYGTGGRPSVRVVGGTALALLGLAADARADGQNGFEIHKGGTTLRDFGGSADYSRGFADLSNAANVGMTIAMRDFDSFFPSSIELAGNGNATVEIFSKYGTKPDSAFDWGVHDTRDLLLDFHASASDPVRSYYRVQYPLAARAPYEQYRDSGGILGRTTLMSFDEMLAYHDRNLVNGVNQWQAANRTTYGVSRFTMPNQQIVRTRSYVWSEGGRESNNDYGLPKLLTYLQIGVGGQFQTAYNLVHFVVDQAIHHSDREDRTTWPAGLEATTTGPRSSLLNGGSGNKFEEDMEHMNTLSVPLLYYLTGDESIKEALLDHGEWLVREHPGSAGCTSNGRGSWQRAKWHSILWELFNDNRFKAELDRQIDNTLCARIVESTTPSLTDDGFDHNRGFDYHRSESDPTHRAVGAGGGLVVRPESFVEAYRVLPDSDPRKDDLGDQIVGQAYWAAREAYFDRSDNCPAMGQASIPDLGINRSPGDDYFVDYPSGAESTRTRANMFDMTALLGFAFRQTADPLFLEVGRRIVGAFAGAPSCNGTLEAVRQLYAPYNGLAAQSFVWLDTHRDSIGSLFLSERDGLQVANDGNGSYTLRWIVPAGAVKYQIKYGPQPMVPNLNFDKDARTYQYGPNVYDNFWAGNGEGVTNQPRNVPNEPLPGAPGSEQTYNITGLDPAMTYRFAMRIETDGSSGPVPTPRAPTMF